MKQLLIIAIPFLFTGMAGYIAFKKHTAFWLKANLILLLAGIGGSYVAEWFVHPYTVWRNIPVFFILISSAFNVFYFFNELFLKWGQVVKEVVGFLSVLAGTVAGTLLVNASGIAYFGAGDIKDTLLIALIFNAGRAAVNVFKMLAEMRKHRKELELTKLKEVNAQARLDLLHAKINPHFLYNSLNSIASLATVDGKKTQQMTIALSRLLRYSINYTDNNFSTLKEELEIVKDYCEIEKIRFEDNFAYEIDAPAEAMEYLVPRFLLQPLVENCIKHAFNGNKGIIQVNAVVENRSLIISVHDNGQPFPENIKPGYGLKHVTDKLQLLLPGKHELQLCNSPQKEIKLTLHELRIQECSPALN